MSNEEKAPPQQQLVVPDYLKAMQGTQQSTSVDSIASAAMSIPRVSMRGKKFRFMEGGEEVLAVNDKIDIVIIGVEPEAGRFIKTFYANPYGGANANNPPDCASDDGVVPSGWITNPQSRSCAECPKNRFGSAVSRANKPAKACRDSKRLWIARADEVKKGENKPTLYAMGVPVTSLKALAEFGREMKGMNVPISAAVCQVTMDDDSEFPLISFKCVGFLAEEQAKLAIERGQKEEWKLSIVSRPALTQGQVPNVALPGQPQPAQQPQAQQPAAPAADAPPAQPKQANMDEIIKTW